MALAAAALAFGVAAGSGGATSGTHVFAETPGSAQAAIFSVHAKLKKDAIKFVHEKLQEHNYTVTEYVDTGLGGGSEGATAANFLNLSGKGVVFIDTHGSDTKLVVEWYGAQATRDAALAAYGAPFVAGDLEACDFSVVLVSAYAICITQQGIANHFEDDDTIVHVASCNSFGLAGSFSAREYFGYSDVCDPKKGDADTKLLWGRMHGEKDKGAYRAARIAFQAGGFTKGFSHAQKSEDTVLSPAVLLHKPADGAELTFGSPLLLGNLAFDTPMDTSIDPATVLTVEGCVAVFDRTWFTPYSITFDYTPTGIGKATFTVHWAQARSGTNFQNHLDGNQNPKKDHVGPNRDDHKWTVSCRRP